MNRQEINKRKTEVEVERQQRVRAARKEALALLSTSTPAGQVWQHLRTKYKLTEPTADRVMRAALSRLIPKYGYLSSQIRTVAQTALQKLVNTSRNESIRLQASKRLRKHFANGDEGRAVEACPQLLTSLDEQPTQTLLAERDRLRAELRLATDKARRKRGRLGSLTTHWDRSRASKEDRNGFNLVQEVMILLAHPFRTAEIVEIMKKRHDLTERRTEHLIGEATRYIERNATLHPVQIELLNQKLSVDILKSEDATEQEKLRAVETLLDSAPSDTTKDNTADAAGIELLGRINRLDTLLPEELESLIGDLWKDAKRRWNWRR